MCFIARYLPRDRNGILVMVVYEMGKGHVIH
jgi:hypothetical protein